MRASFTAFREFAADLTESAQKTMRSVKQETAGVWNRVAHPSERHASSRQQGLGMSASLRNAFHSSRNNPANPASTPRPDRFGSTSPQAHPHHAAPPFNQPETQRRSAHPNQIPVPGREQDYAYTAAAEEQHLQEAIDRSLGKLPRRGSNASLPERGVTANRRSVNQIARKPVRPDKIPTFFDQDLMARKANQDGVPSYNICGSLALAHMTNRAANPRRLHELAMTVLLNKGMSRQKAEQKIYDGVPFELLSTALNEMNIPHNARYFVRGEDNAAIIGDMLNAPGCNGVTYGYTRRSADTSPARAYHFAALRKIGDQWWSLDSKEAAPVKLEETPGSFLERHASQQIAQYGQFEMMTVAQPPEMPRRDSASL